MSQLQATSGLVARLARWWSVLPKGGGRNPGVLQDGELALALNAWRAWRPARADVPAYEFAMRHAVTGVAMGRIALRVGDHPRLAHCLGHIGYFVEPEHRGHRYAARAIRLLLPLAWRHGLDSVWITCNPDNPASRRSIELAGGGYVDTVPVPSDDPLYLQGDRAKCRFRFGSGDDAPVAGARR